MHIECLMVVVGRTLGIPNTVPSNIYLSLTTRQDPIKHPAGIISFNPLTICSHFTDEETEARRSYMTCLGSMASCVMPGFRPQPSASRIHALNQMPLS